MRRKQVAEDSLNISVHLVSGEVELAVCRGTEPIFLRLIRIAIDDPQRVAEQVWMETQRCLTILPTELAELPKAWFVFTTCEAAWHVDRSLEDRDVTVQPVEPLFGWEWDGPNDALVDEKQLADQSTSSGTESDGSGTSDELVEPTATSAPIVLLAQTSAATAGAAWEFLHGELPINMLAAKRAPTAPNPLRRWGSLSRGCHRGLGVGIYFMLSDVSKLRNEVSELENDLIGEKKLAAKFLEKADQVDYVESWLSDQVDWLAELNELSGRLPNGEQATVRRLTASASGKIATVDLSLQVAQQTSRSSKTAFVAPSTKPLASGLVRMPMRPSIRGNLKPTFPFLSNLHNARPTWLEACNDERSDGRRGGRSGGRSDGRREGRSDGSSGEEPSVVEPEAEASASDKQESP